VFSLSFFLSAVAEISLTNCGSNWGTNARGQKERLEKP
jgi:hypothetical protein